MLKFIDLFCGAGGVTTGIEQALSENKKIAEVIACVNHDPIAIESHFANHPSAVHIIYYFYNSSFLLTNFRDIIKCWLKC